MSRVRAKRPLAPRAAGRGEAAEAPFAFATLARAARDPRRLARAAAALTLLWCVLFAPQLFAGKVFALGDARVYRPFSEFSRERWNEHHVRTYWNPYVLNGIAASASLADMRPQYLPDVALNIAEHLRPPQGVPLAGPLFAHLLGMLAMAALAWSLWDLPVVGLVWAGAAFGLTPILLVPFAFGHDAFLAACSLMPLELLCVQALALARRPLWIAAAALALAAVAGVQALTGHPQVVVYSQLVTLAFLAERSLRLRRAGPLLAGLLALAWGAAIAMALWLPAMHYGEHSNRGGGVSIEQVRRMSMAWYELVTLAWPRAVGGEGDTYWGGFTTTDYPRFLGTLTMTFLALGALRRRAPRPEGYGFFLTVTLVAIALALGPRLGPLYTVVFHQLPFFEKFRVTSMALTVGSMGAALLGATLLVPGGDSPGGEAGAGRSRGPLVLLALAGTGILLGLGVRSGSLQPAYLSLARALRPALSFESALLAARSAGFDLAWRVPLLCAGVGLLALLRARNRPWPGAGIALVALLLVDLVPVSLPTLQRATAAPEVLRHPVTPLLARIGAEHPEARVLSLRTYDVSAWQVAGSGRAAELLVNDWIRWHAHAYGGDHGTPPLEWGGMEMLENLDAMRALGVVYVCNVPGSPLDSAVAEPVASAPDEVVYRLRGALTRAYAVPRVVNKGGDAAVFASMRAPGFDPAREALTIDPAAVGEYPGSAGCRIRWLADEPDTLALEITAPATAFVIVADSWFPGWSATLDGRPVPIRRVNQMVRGVSVPAGEHRLDMVYVPEGWARAVPVTRIAMALWAGAAVAWLLLLARDGLRARRSSALPAAPA